MGFKKGNNFIILHLSRHKVVITLSFTHDVIFWEIYIINIAALFLLSAALAICAAYFLQLWEGGRLPLEGCLERVLHLSPACYATLVLPSSALLCPPLCPFCALLVLCHACVNHPCCLYTTPLHFQGVLLCPYLQYHTWAPLQHPSPPGKVLYPSHWDPVVIRKPGSRDSDL